MPFSLSWAAGILAASGASAAGQGSVGLRGSGGQRALTGARLVDSETGILQGDSFTLAKRYDLSKGPEQDFDIEVHSDEFLTHSCANYVDDGSTVFSRDGDLVLKVASHCEGGGCLNSGRIMSRESYKYGLFTFTAKVPKCNHIWPAIWLLPEDVTGNGAYGTWPCSGEIDVLETVHDGPHGTFNLVSGYGEEPVHGLDGAINMISGLPQMEVTCNKCQPLVPDGGPGYRTSTTMHPETFAGLNPYFVDASANCSAGKEHVSWEEHTWVLNWQPDQLTTWVDPVMEWDADGRLVSVQPKPTPPEAKGVAMWKSFSRQTSPEWMAVGEFMSKCFEESATPHAPFDIGFKIVLNVAIGGYGGAPCTWGSDACQTVCGGAVGSELVMSDISVWQRAM